MSLWAEIRSFGCFVYFEGEPGVAARVLIEAMVGDLGLEGDVELSTDGRWRRFDRKVIDRAIATSRIPSIAMMVGTSTDVRLGGELELHLRPPLDDHDLELRRPPLAWFAAESQRWPEATFVIAARHWLRLAARHGAVLSGGVLAAADLRNAKVEITQGFDTYPGEVPDRSPTSFRGRMEQEPPARHLKTKIRRVYPITLLGPKFTSQVDIVALRDAGATNVEPINNSTIFDSTPSLIEAWSPEFLAATTALRRLLWPLSMQNPADDPDAKSKPRRGSRLPE